MAVESFYRVPLHVTPLPERIEARAMELRRVAAEAEAERAMRGDRYGDIPTRSVLSMLKDAAKVLVSADESHSQKRWL